jgi:hypothetical protein
MKEEAQMYALRLGQRLVVAVALSLTLLTIGLVWLGMAIQHGAIRPPEMDVAISGLHLVAFTTGRIECQPYLPCLETTQDYYVVWVFRKTAPDKARKNGRRILTMPLQR